MSFLKNTLGLAEKFLDGLDKTESSKATPSHHPPTPERPLFPRRSASHAVEGQITPPTSTGRSFSIPLEGINSIDVSAKDDAPLAPRSAGSGSGAPDLPFAGNAGAVSSSAEAGLPATEDPRPSRASSGADSGQDTHAHVPRPCRSSSHAHDPGDASAVLMNAVKDKEVKILHLTEAVEQLRREKADLEADLSDREADLTAALSDLDRARRTIASLEQQIKDSYAEVRPHALAGMILESISPPYPRFISA